MEKLFINRGCYALTEAACCTNEEPTCGLRRRSVLGCAAYLNLPYMPCAVFPGMGVSLTTSSASIIIWYC